MFYKIALLAFFAVLATSAEVTNGDSMITSPIFTTTIKAPTTNVTSQSTTSTPTTASTTSSPPTTSAPPTTSPPPTTPSPPPPTTPAPTTTPSPTSTPTPPPVAPWIVKDNVTGAACILAKAKIHFNIPYNTTDKQTKIAQILVPENATVTGHCGQENQTLGLSWNNTNYLMFTFQTNKTTHEYWISSISARLTAYPHIFKNSSEKVMFYELSHGGKDFVTHVNKSYQCNVGQELQMNVHNQTGKVAKIDFTSMKMNAFHSSKPNEVSFDAAYWCESGQTPDIVPIVVGCVLAALVILVLVGYLIGRRRSQARGYLSM